SGSLAKLTKALEILEGSVNAAAALRGLSLAEDYGEVVKRFEAEDSEYYRLRQEQQQLNESLKKEETLRAQITHLQRMEAELKSRMAREQALVGQRANCRASMARLSDEIYSLRLAEVESINKKHSDVILLMLTPGEQTGEYRQRLIH